MPLFYNYTYSSWPSIKAKRQWVILIVKMLNYIARHDVSSSIDFHFNKRRSCYCTDEHLNPLWWMFWQQLNRETRFYHMIWKGWSISFAYWCVIESMKMLSEYVPSLWTTVCSVAMKVDTFAVANRIVPHLQQINTKMFFQMVLYLKPYTYFQSLTIGSPIASYSVSHHLVCFSR